MAAGILSQHLSSPAQKDSVAGRIKGRGAGNTSAIVTLCLRDSQKRQRHWKLGQEESRLNGARAMRVYLGAGGDEKCQHFSFECPSPFAYFLLAAGNKEKSEMLLQNPNWQGNNADKNRVIFRNGVCFPKLRFDTFWRPVFLPELRHVLLCVIWREREKKKTTLSLTCSFAP